ncbi:hypothetical protein KP509_30G060300 [Ceratopteris richardii]|uniref:Solute carrier family 40 member n=1 Tax=Ceratopteris richardii TaxID=49495 RepID=A0A8T2R539_CERRI|nr:hypothetical protein KP509_30G060300 [Ceratopteris richardii]
MELMLTKFSRSPPVFVHGLHQSHQCFLSHCPRVVRKCWSSFQDDGGTFSVNCKGFTRELGYSLAWRDSSSRKPYGQRILCFSKTSDNMILDSSLCLETPEFPEALQYLYWTYVASCLVERAWRFALPALMALLSESLLPVALNSFISQLFVFVGGPLVGIFMDTVPRVLAFTVLSFMQTVSILVSAAMIVYATSNGLVLGSSALSILKLPWFSVLLLANAIDRITGIATGVAFERDWVVLLAGRSRTVALARANAMLRRVDLICEIIGPFVFGLALSKYSSVQCILISCVTAIVSLPLLILLVHHTYNVSNGVLDRPSMPIAADNKQSSSPGLKVFTQGWILYLVQPILPASIAYVLLSFNNVLAPSSLMTTFLTQRGLNPAVIGSYRGACALMGFLATYLASLLIGKFGTIKAGAISLTCQTSLLIGAVLLYFLCPMQNQSILFFFLLLVVLSRLGHWAYDMVIAQIFQTAVPLSNANVVSSAEMSLASFAELMMLAIAIIANDISHFGALACMSMAAVAIATSLYWAWSISESTKVLFKDQYV